MVLESIASYLTNLTATNDICSELGTLVATGVNLFIGFEPDALVDTITLIPYGGTPPNVDNQRLETSINIRVRAKNSSRAIKVSQKIIEQFSNNHLNGVGAIRAVQSAPIYLGKLEGGEWSVTTSNYTIKHVKD